MVKRFKDGINELIGISAKHGWKLVTNPTHRYLEHESGMRIWLNARSIAASWGNSGKYLSVTHDLRTADPEYVLADIFLQMQGFER